MYKLIIPILETVCFKRDYWIIFLECVLIILFRYFYINKSMLFLHFTIRKYVQHYNSKVQG